MAEAHPVAYQWVVEAKARGATVDPRRPALQPHERARRHVRAAARRHRHRVPRRRHQPRAQHRVGLPRVRARLHQRADDHRRGVRRRRRRRAVLGLRRRATRRYDPTSWQYEGAFVAAAAGQRDQEGNVDALAGEGEARRAESARGEPKLDPTLAAPALRLADPQAPLRAATRPRWSSASAACPQDAVRARSASCSSRTPGASARRRSCTASAGPSTRSARSTSAPRRSCSCCSATWAGPAAA